MVKTIIKQHGKADSFLCKSGKVDSFL